MKKKKGHQRSRLRVDPFNLLQQLCEQDCTLSELQQRTGFDPAEIKPLRAAGKIHLDSARLNAAPSVHSPPGKPDASHGTPRHRTAPHGIRCKEIPRCSQ